MPQISCPCSICASGTCANQALMAFSGVPTPIQPLPRVYYSSVVVSVRPHFSILFLELSNFYFLVWFRLEVDGSLLIFCHHDLSIKSPLFLDHTFIWGLHYSILHFRFLGPVSWLVDTNFWNAPFSSDRISLSPCGKVTIFLYYIDEVTSNLKWWLPLILRILFCMLYQLVQNNSFVAWRPWKLVHFG